MTAEHPFDLSGDALGRGAPRASTWLQSPMLDTSISFWPEPHSALVLPLLTEPVSKMINFGKRQGTVSAVPQKRQKKQGLLPPKVTIDIYRYVFTRIFVTGC